MPGPDRKCIYFFVSERMNAKIKSNSRSPATCSNFSISLILSSFWDIVRSSCRYKHMFVFDHTNHYVHYIGR